MVGENVADQGWSCLAVAGHINLGFYPWNAASVAIAHVLDDPCVGAAAIGVGRNLTKRLRACHLALSPVLSFWTALMSKDAG